MPGYRQSSNNNFTSLYLQRMVHCKLAERLGTALLVFLPGAFVRSDSALLHFAEIGRVPVALG